MASSRAPKQARRRKRRTYNVRLVRRNLSYEIREIAELFSLHPQAVRRWQQRGLTPNDERRPLLFHGSEIIRFLSETQVAQKKAVPTGQIYCCACRAPRRPTGGVVTVRLLGRTKLNLIGACPECSSQLNRFGSVAKFPDYRKHFAVRETAQCSYFRFLAEADRKSQTTIDAVRKAITRFESHPGFKDLATFNRHQAVAFKKHLATTSAERTGRPLSKSTMHATSNALKAFFRWLYSQPGYRSRISPTDIEYLNLPERDVRAAKQPAVKRFPTLEQIRHVIASMPVATVIDRRNRALLAFTIVTGMRDDAIASVRLKHVEADLRRVIQNPREMRTKFSKQIITYFFPVEADLQEIVLEWVRELREVHLFGNDDPVFPTTRIVQDDDHCFVVDGIEPRFWANAEPIRVVFRRAFRAAGLDYYNPHSFRDTLAALGKKLCRTPEEFEAWSKNLGHEEMITTFPSYGHLDPARQGELINTVGDRDEDEDRLEKMYGMIERLAKKEAESG